MPTLDLFGNPIYSKEELKAIEAKKQAEEKAKKEAELKKKAEAEKLKATKTSYTADLESIVGNVENQDELNQDIKNIKSAKSIEEAENIHSKYNDLIEKEKKKRLEEEKKIKKAQAQAAEEKKNPKYKYPFVIHYAGRNIETDNMFKHGVEYTADQIRTKMLENQYYEFSGSVTFEYLKDDNVLLPIFAQYKKG